MAQKSTNRAIETIYQNYLRTNQFNGDEVKHVHSTIYKKYLSKQISAHCQFNHSCSLFMFESMQQFSIAKGVLLGIDRLTRCGASDGTYNFLPSLKLQNINSFVDLIDFYE